MRRFLLIVVLAGVVVMAGARQPLDEPMMRIEEHTKEMADNTKPILVWNGKTYDSWVLLGASLLSLLVGIVSTWYSMRTAHNAGQTARNVKEQTRQQEINRPAQDAILRDLILHLYRNKVVVCAMRWKLTDLGFDKCYPSEEQLLKLKVLPEDLRLDRFDSAPEHYDELHKLRMLFRNYTIDVDVALAHLKTKALPQSVKTGDLLALENKSQLLTEKIRKLMNCTGLNITDEEIRDILLEKDDDHHPVRRKPRDGSGNTLDRSGDEDQYYDLLGLTAQLNDDIACEYNHIDTIGFPA
jgi:hypothetical protein